MTSCSIYGANVCRRSRPSGRPQPAAELYQRYGLDDNAFAKTYKRLPWLWRRGDEGRFDDDLRRTSAAIAS